MKEVLPTVTLMKLSLKRIIIRINCKVMVINVLDKNKFIKMKIVIKCIKNIKITV